MTIRFVFTTPGKALSLSCKRCSLVQHQRERKLSVDVTWASEYGSAILQKRENLRVRRRQLSRTKRGFASWDAFSLSVCKCVWVFLFLSFCRGRDASREFSRFVSEILCWQFWVFNFSLTYPYLFFMHFFLIWMRFSYSRVFVCYRTEKSQFCLIFWICFVFVIFYVGKTGSGQ